MAKKLNDPSKGNKNLGTKQRGLGMLINPEPEIPQKVKASSKEFDTEDVKIYSLRIPTDMFDKLKYEIGRETKASMRDMILTAIAKHYNI
ncbi:hypothetical protein [Algoriphagus persicinus]|uniref:hypothetical protein n=1 Tax=Algoriphagus persicinus TaxID=3108754 RepID=UPI002B3AE51D|nr:hypothetical protein [Algoriphagus sp. E1-3-M2]MEB2786555.1 hypothetical protein [Algoriphagus sp. E1-3-M2]